MSNEPTTKLNSSRTIFALLFVIPIFSVLLYGSTDISALIPLSVLTAALGSVWIVRVWRQGRLRLNTDAIQLPLIGLILLGIVQLLPLGDPGVPQSALSAAASNALSLDPFSTRVFVFRLIGYSIFFAAALTFIDSGRRYRSAIAVIVIFGGTVAFLGILQKLASPEAIYGVRKHTGAIPFGPYINQHHFASLMVLFSGVAFAHLLGRGFERQVKLLIGISLAIMTIAVLLTGSRGGIISYLAMVSVSGLAWFYTRRGESTAVRGWLPLAAGGLVAVLAVLGTALFVGGGDSLMRGIGLGDAAGDVTSGRLHFWTVAWEIFKANPIIGAGLDAFGVAYTRFDTGSGLFRVEQAHNEYLQMLADGGITAFALTIAFIVILFRRAMGRLQEEKSELIRTTVIGCFAGCVGIFVHSLFDFPLRTAGNAYCFLLVIALLLAPVSSAMLRPTSRER